MVQERYQRFRWLVGTRWVRRFRDDAAFERELVYDQDLEFAAMIVNGPLAGNYDPEPLTDAELEALERARL